MWKVLIFSVLTFLVVEVASSHRFAITTVGLILDSDEIVYAKLTGKTQSKRFTNITIQTGAGVDKGKVFTNEYVIQEWILKAQVLSSLSGETSNDIEIIKQDLPFTDALKSWMIPTGSNYLFFVDKKDDQYLFKGIHGVNNGELYFKYHSKTANGERIGVGTNMNIPDFMIWAGEKKRTLRRND